MSPPLYPPLVQPVAVPADHNLLGWTFDPGMVQAGLILPTAGLLNLARLRVYGTVVSTIHLHITVGGSTLTAGQCFAALFNSAGAHLGAGAITADQATAWQSGGLKSMALSTPQAVTFGENYYVGWWANGTTMPTFSRAINSASAILNAGLSAPNFRYASANTGLTTAAPSNFGTQTGTATGWWVGVS